MLKKSKDFKKVKPQKRDCQLCRFVCKDQWIFKKLVASALYKKFSSSQNLYYISQINNFVQQKHKSIVIKLKYQRQTNIQSQYLIERYSFRQIQSILYQVLQRKYQPYLCNQKMFDMILVNKMRKRHLLENSSMNILKRFQRLPNQNFERILQGINFSNSRLERDLEIFKSRKQTESSLRQLNYKLGKVISRYCDIDESRYDFINKSIKKTHKPPSLLKQTNFNKTRDKHKIKANRGSSRQIKTARNNVTKSKHNRQQSKFYNKKQTKKQSKQKCVASFRKASVYTSKRSSISKSVRLSQDNMICDNIIKKSKGKNKPSFKKKQSITFKGKSKRSGQHESSNQGSRKISDYIRNNCSKVPQQQLKFQQLRSSPISNINILQQQLLLKAIKKVKQTNKIQLLNLHQS